jgi:hypothetical protein
MYRCQLCRCVVPAGTSSQRLVVQSRHKEYQFRSRANVVVRRKKENKTKKEFRDDPGGEGQEIVQELIICPACAAKNSRQ